MTAVAVLAVAAPVQQQRIDTVIPAPPGTRVEVDNFGGETVVKTWDRPEIRVQADLGTRERVEIRTVGTMVSIRSQGRMGPPRGVDYAITVPARTDLNVSGVYQDVTVDGVQGSIAVSTVNGDVTVQGGTGFISLKSVEGDVALTGARGRMALSSVNADVRVESSDGDIQAESVNGDVDLLGVTSASVDATTVNGDLTYDGPIRDGGHYAFDTNNGDITVTVPETANTTVSVETFSGEFESAFPVRLTQSRKNRFTFVLGDGNGRLSLQSFQGTIRLARPGELRGRGTGVRIRNRTKVKVKSSGGYNYNYRYHYNYDYEFADHPYESHHNRGT